MPTDVENLKKDRSQIICSIKKTVDNMENNVKFS